MTTINKYFVFFNFCRDLGITIEYFRQRGGYMLYRWFVFFLFLKLIAEPILLYFMLREFLVYLYCIFTGKDPSFTYELPYPGGDWPALVQHFKSLKWKPYTYSDEVFISVEEGVIKINEFYDSGFADRGTNMRYDNEVETLMRLKDGILEITITVSRVTQYRIFVIMIFFLFAVFSLLMILSMRAYMHAEEINGNLPLIIVLFSIFLCLIPVIWLVSRWKHRQVFKQISKILKSVPQNIAT